MLARFTERKYFKVLLCSINDFDSCSDMVHALTHGVYGAVVVHYPSQEIAEAAFDLAQRAGSVQVI